MYIYSSSAGLVGLEWVGTSQYSTSVVSIKLQSSLSQVIVYLFFIYLYVALYDASHVAAIGVGVHHINSYVYCASAGWLASACVGTTQYSTVVVSITLPSSFFHVIV